MGVNSCVAECRSQKVPKCDFGHFRSSNEYAHMVPSDSQGRYDFVLVLSLGGTVIELSRKSLQTVIPKNKKNKSAHSDVGTGQRRCESLPPAKSLLRGGLITTAYM